LEGDIAHHPLPQGPRLEYINKAKTSPNADKGVLKKITLAGGILEGSGRTVIVCSGSGREVLLRQPLHTMA